MRAEQRAAGCEDASVAGERIEYVGEEHVFASDGNQHRAGDGGGADSWQTVAVDAAADWDADSEHRFVARGAVEFLYGNFAHSKSARRGERRGPEGGFVCRVPGGDDSE